LRVLTVGGSLSKGTIRAESRWLRDTIPGATDVVEIDGARLFFPDDASRLI